MTNSKKDIFLPPHDLRLEEIVLGSIMIETEAYHEISAMISESSFYDIKHSKIFKAIRNLAAATIPIDFITVVQQLRKNGDIDTVGGAGYVTQLINDISSSANICVHAAIIQQKFLERETIKIAQQTIKNITQGTNDIFEVQDNLINSLQKLTDFDSGQISQLSEIIRHQLKQYEIKPTDGLTGVPTGLPSLDRITSGWQRSNLIILAGRPSMGKTALMLNLARNASIIGDASVVIFSLEMSKEQLTDRLISAETEIPLDLIMKRNLEPYQWVKFHAMNDLINSKLFIDDTSQISINSMRSKCAKMKRNHDVKLIVIDYLQLMKGEPETKFNREQEISSISRGLKGIAKDLDVPVIALSQLSRKVEERAGIDGKRPLLSDLRESGSIEQDADQVIFMFRPEYYGMLVDAAGNDLKGKTEINFAKNRNGPLDTIGLDFNGSKMQFCEISDRNLIELNTEIDDNPAF